MGSSCTNSSLCFPVVFYADSVHYLLLRNRTVESISWSIPGLYTKKTEVEISKGELLFLKQDLLYVNGNESVAFEYEKEDESVSQLDDGQYNFLNAISTAKGRSSVLATPGWRKWGADVKKGDEVYIRVIKDGMECCSTAVVRYIGYNMTGDHPGTRFGVEITVS